MQCAHAVSVLAAHCGEPDRWAHTTLVVHAVAPAELFELVATHSCRQFGSGVRGDVAYFSEPDLLFAPTAVAAPGDQFAHFGLWSPPAATGKQAGNRLGLRRLAVSYRRAGGSPGLLMADAAEFGDPWQLAARHAAAHLFVHGEPPVQGATP